MAALLRVALLALCTLLLSACFVSETPLIAETDSVTPIAPGTYRSADESASSGEEGIVTVEGTKTILSDKDDSGDVYLMRKVRGDYYVMMELPKDKDDGYIYMLVRVSSSSFISFDFSDYCEALQTLAQAQGVSIESYGVARVEDGDSASCYFTKFGDLARAFETLLDNAAFHSYEVFTRVP